MPTEDQKKIYIDRLKDGHIEHIKEEISNDFLDINDPDLLFSPLSTIEGETYLANDHLILRLKVQLEVTIPCSICNAPVTLPLLIQNFYHTEELSSLKKPIFDYAPLLREAILLNAPDYTECNEGFCPERKNIKKFLHREETNASSHKQFPFADLDKE